MVDKVTISQSSQFKQIDTNEHSTEIQVLSFDSVILVTRRTLAYK